MLGYCDISQKFLSVDVWIGLCENSHNANGKKIRDMKLLKKWTKWQKSVYVRVRGKNNETIFNTSGLCKR